MTRFLAYACVVLGALCFIMIGVIDCSLKEKFSRAEYGTGAMAEGPEKDRLHKLIRKHGLQYDVAVIHDWPDAPWYIDKKGRRIKLK